MAAVSDRKDIRRIIKFYAIALQKDMHIDAIYLFGSYAYKHGSTLNPIPANSLVIPMSH
jgi:hypothetical protein